jgi:hypothetical protein
MSLDRLRYEWQLMGKQAVLPPVLTLLGYGLFALLLHCLKTNPARFLESGPEMILPMIVGMFAGTLVSYDPALEIQLTMPRKYHVTGLLRIVLIIAWTACCALLLINGAAALRLEYMLQPPHPQPVLIQFLARQLVWLAPLFWCVGLASSFGLLLRSRAAGAAVLGGVWIAEIIFKDVLASFSWLWPLLLFPTTLVTPPSVVPQHWYDAWLSSRFEVLGTGLILLLVAWLLLHNPEGLLKISNEE